MNRGALFMACMALAGSAWGFDIKGVKVDQPIDCTYIKTLGYPLGRVVDPCETGQRIWETPISFLDGKASMLITQSEARRVLSIYVLGFDFDLALQSLTAKYGQPRIERSVIQNKAGANFDQVEATWQEGAEMLVVGKHSSRIGRPFILLTGAEHDTDAKAKQKERQNKALGNM